MPLTRGYTDEIKELNAEPIIGSAVGELLDDTVTRIAKHIDIPLRLYASATPDQYLNIGASMVSAGDGAGKSAPPVDSALPVIAGGQIGFTVRTAPAFVKKDGGTFTFPTPSALNKYFRLAFSVDGLGNLNGVWDAERSTTGAMVDPGLLHVQAAGVPVGYIDLESTTVGGAAEVTDVTCVADVGGNLAGKYFIFNMMSSGGSSVGFYVWYFCSDLGTGTNPAVPGRTGIVVSYLQNDTAASIVSKSAIAVSAGISLYGSTSYAATYFRINSAYNGAVTDASNVTTSFTYNVVTQGVTAGYGFKTIGSATNVIENSTSSTPRIVRYGSGSGSGGSGAGASLLDPNYDETFIYYTRSDFSIEKKTFFGSTTGSDNILGLKKISLTTGNNFISGNLLGSVFLADNPVINTAQVRLLYNVGKVDTYLGSYSFTVSSSNFAAGDVYSHNGVNYTLLNTGIGSNLLIATGVSAPLASGTLTRVTGSGTDPITFSAVVSGIAVSADGGTTWNFPYQVYRSGLFVVADFVLPSGTTSTDFRVKVSAVAASSELAGFGVNLVQDNTGSYAGDATYEMRTISSTEASTGTITLASVRFTPGANQLHVNYNGHDFMAPDFLELGGGVVQFPAAFFNTGDVAKFYVSYGLVKEGDAAITINNVISANTTMGSLQIPTGFTLDKPYMEIPYGATVSGAGNVSTDRAITGAGILATTGTVLSRGVAPTQPTYDYLTVNAEAKAGSLKLPTSGGTPTGLTYYEEGSFSATFTGPVTVTATCNFVRVGRQVTLHLESKSGTSTVAAAFGTAAGTLPARLRPAITVNFLVRSYDNGAQQEGGVFWVGSDGTLQVQKNFAGTGLFTASGVAGWNPCHVSYLVP